MSVNVKSVTELPLWEIGAKFTVAAVSETQHPMIH